MNTQSEISEIFLKSALTEKNPHIKTSEVLEWVEERRSNIHVAVEPITFDTMDKWKFSENRASIQHETGRFFSIDGIKVETTWGNIPTWCQPIINQPEVGYLGIITKLVDGVLYFLMQAKIEPGNIGTVQISPTIQATRSNYTRAHQGKGQIFLGHFLDRKKNRVLVDQLQSEQGARFLRKRNRNIIILSHEDVPHDENYRWLTLGQIKELMRFDNIVSMDTRTVVSGIPYGPCFSGAGSLLRMMAEQKDHASRFAAGMLESTLETNNHLYTFEELLSWFTNAKQSYDLEVSQIPLNKVEDWDITENSISHIDHRFFKVIPVKVSIEGREVQNWCQPMVQPMQEGLIGFITKRIDGIYHFLVQAKLECGNFDVLELAPTVQCLTGRHLPADNSKDPFLKMILNAPKNMVMFDSLQSEEGGRFYQEQNRNIIVEIAESEDLDIPENYTWITANQLSTFVKFNNYLNIQARSLLSVLNFRAPEHE